MAPEAPRAWAWNGLLAEMGMAQAWSRKTLLMARVSVASLSGVDDPCGLMKSTVSAWTPAESRAMRMARAAWAPSGLGVECVVGGAVAGHLGKDAGTATTGVVEGFEHEYAGALAHDEAVAIAVEGSTRVLGVMVAGGHGADGGECAEAQGREGRLDAAGEGDIGTAVADEAERIADGDGAGSAGHGVGGIGSVEPELDGDGAAGGACESGEGDTRIECAAVAGVEGARLCFGVGDAAESRTHLHGDAFRVDAAAVEAGVIDCDARGGNGEVTEAVESPGEFPVHVVSGLEVVDFGCNPGAPRRRVETRDAADGRTFPAQAIPERLRAGACSSNGPHTGDDNATQWSCGFMHAEPPG
jgi:hypothetical protein